MTSPHPPPTDEQLLERAHTGDRAALDLLIRCYANLVYGCAQRQTGDAQLAADVAQAVFIVLLRRIKTVRSARALPAWLMQTTRFAVKEAQRAQRRRDHHEKRAARPESAMPQTNEPFESAGLDRAIAALRKTDRTIIAMRFLQNRPIEEVAQSLGIATDAARKRVARALERLKDLLPQGDALFSLDAALATAAAVSMPSHVLESCIALTTHATGSSAAASTLARAIAQRLAMKKLALVTATVLTPLVIAAGAITIHALDGPTHFTSAVKFVEPHTSPDPNAVKNKAQALAQLAQTYPPDAGQAMRFVPYPFSAARTAFVDAEYPYAHGADNVRSIGLEWDGKTLHAHYMSYVDQTLSEIVDLGLGIPWYNVDGLDKVKFPKLHGDFVVRTDASPQERLDSLAALIAQQTQRHVRFVHSTRKLWCMILSGDTRPAPKNAGGFEVFVLTQTPPDDAAIRRWVKGIDLPGSTHAYSMQEASHHLAAPFFLADEHPEQFPHLEEAGQFMAIAPDARLKLDDPQLHTKLQKILDSVHHQIGGEWTLEQRELDVYTLTEIPK